MPPLSVTKKLEIACQASKAGQSMPVETLGEHEGGGLPEDLWDRAYESLMEDKVSRKLMDAYEKILLSELKDDPSVPAAADGKEISTRGRNMLALVRKKVKAMDDARWKFQLGERSVELKTQVDRIVKAILFAKDFISPAVSAEPHAALAWAGVCMLLPLLLNPEIQKNALVEGLDYISSLVVRFTTIERLYHKQGPKPRSLLDQEDFEELNRAFEAQLTKLYSKILSYQAQVICQMRRHTLIRNGRDIFKLDDWSNLLNDIKKAEAACTGISQVVDSEKLEATLADLSCKLDVLLYEHTQHYVNLQNTADHILTGIAQSRKEQQQWHRTDEESRCMQALCTSAYEDHKDRNPPRVLNTCLWFLRNQRFVDWLARGSSDLLWVTADPGCGKSVLSRSLIDNELQSGPSRTTCYFFFKDIGEQRSATNALCALLHQLCTNSQFVLQQVVRVYQSNGDQMTHSFSCLWRTFLAATSRPEAGEIVCVLDALDECGVRDKVTLIESLNKFYSTRSSFGGRVKFLVTSRPYYDIEDRFDEPVIRLSGEEESEQIGKEIDLVIKDRVPKIAARKKFDCKTQDALQERLLATKSRTYLWLYLALADIDKAFGITNPKKMGEFVNRIPKSVDEAYEVMLNRSPEQVQAQKLLHIVLAAVRPLTLREVNIALNLEEGQKSYEDVELIPETSLQSHIKNVCGLMLTVYDSKLYLLHQTAKEFLVASWDHHPIESHLDFSLGAWKHSMEPSESHLVCQARNWRVHFRLAKDKHELSSAWYDICNTKSNLFKTWLNASYLHSYEEGADLFDMACFLGHDSVVKQLLRPGTDLEKYHATDGGTVLARASKEGYLDVIDTLISHGSSINTKDARGCTPLHYGVETGSETLVNSLLQAGAFANAKNSHSQTPLYLAIIQDHEAVAKTLIRNGASLDSLDDGGRTPLFTAIERNRLDVVNMMLDKGASIDIRDNTGLIPLSYAAWESNGRMVKLLLHTAQHAKFSDLISTNLDPEVEHMEELMFNIIFREASSLDMKFCNGKTVLHWAAMRGMDKKVQKLLDDGASVDMRDDTGYTALTLAVSSNHAEVVRILIGHGANLDVRNAVHETPLMRATQRGFKRIVRMLLEKGAPVNLRNSERMTDLHYAAEAGEAQITQMLLDAGADPNALDNRRLKPLDLARLGGHQTIVELLEPLTNDDHEYRPTLMELRMMIMSQQMSGVTRLARKTS